MGFTDVLRSLRQNSGETQSALAQSIGYSQSTISDWEKGIKEPTSSGLIVLSDHFGVTVDFLLGLNDDVEEMDSHSSDEILLIKKYRSMSATKRKALLDMLDIS